MPAKFVMERSEAENRTRTGSALNLLKFTDSHPARRGRYPMDSSRTNEQRAWRIDTVRQGADGVILALIDSIFILVAIRYFAVGDFWKGLIASSKFLGFLLSAPLTGLLNRTSLPRSRVLFLLTMVSAAALAVGTIARGGITYALAVSLCSAACHIRQPFFTELYGDFYHHRNRARRISLGLMINLVVTLCAGLSYGYILDLNFGWWRWINIGAVAVLLVSGFLLARLPEAESPPRSESWLQAITLPFRNPRFLYVQAAWMLIGFGNLWTIPLRAVYLAEPERGLGLSPSIVTLTLVVVPAGFQFLFNRVWAHLYHRLSFPAMRIAINFFFASAIPLCFLTESLPVIFVSAGLLGIGLSGTPYIWQLWVTRIAGIGEIRIYQSAHAFLSGIRGVLAPFIGFAALRGLSFQGVGLISCALALLSCLMMVPLLRRDRVF